MTQGFTEFLPVSSSGHLVLVPEFFNMADPHAGIRHPPSPGYPRGRARLLHQRRGQDRGLAGRARPHEPAGGQSSGAASFVWLVIGSIPGCHSRFRLRQFLRGPVLEHPGRGGVPLGDESAALGRGYRHGESEAPAGAAGQDAGGRRASDRMFSGPGDRSRTQPFWFDHRRRGVLGLRPVDSGALLVSAQHSRHLRRRSSPRSGTSAAGSRAPAGRPTRWARSQRPSRDS